MQIRRKKVPVNLIEPILFQCASQPAAPALCAVGKEPVTYGSLGRQFNKYRPGGESRRASKPAH